uniref:Phosphoinositide phospholipase C n=1 Tax=Acrobeloides nanus TaxID=290746 RepID=A0A914C2G2_9BILA
MDEGGLGMLSVGGGGGLSREKSEKRSFRRNSGSQEHPMAALLDSTGPKRQTSTRQRSKKPVLTKEEEERIFAEYHYTGATTNIHPLLSTLINYTHPVKFSGFEYSEANNCHFHMSSFSESTGLGYLKASAPEFVNYNKRQLSRIYPKGARVDSSNFLPQIFWNAGCQMVALNFQTSDVCMQLNQGKFEYNGQSGYLLKPDFMRRPDRSFDPFSESPVDGVIAAHCSIRVISGQFLCDRKVGTYVEVEMYGLPTDTIRKEHRTKTVPANGLNPIYNEEPFVFRKVVLPELAVLRFAVYDESGKQLGQRIIPLDGLQAGYRHIGLRTETNMPTTLPTLFVHIVIKTYVPDELSGLVDALADPKAYLSAQEKRKEALHNMGVDESDIVEVPADTTNMNDKVAQKQKSDPRQKLNGAASPLSQEHRQNSAFIPVQKDGSIKANETSENKFKVETINVAELRKDKCFQKLSKKLQKDMEELKKRHQKQRDTIQKQQQSTVDKMMSDSHKMSKKESKKNNLHNTNSGNGTSRHASLSGRSSDSARSPSAFSDMANNQKMRSLVSTQMDEWSKLIQKQQLEEFELRKAHINEEFDMLRRLLSDAQKQQMTALKTKLDNENKELKQSQTKKSMEDTKLIQQDKNIKTKAERDRRVKELNEKNVKVFVEERKRLAMKSQMHEEQLTKRHTEQVEILEKEASKAIELEDMNHRESLLASRPESVV